MSSEYVEGVKCPLCDEEKMLVLLDHNYSKANFGLKWYYCDACDKDVCRDKLSGSWKVSAYDIIDLLKEREEEEKGEE